MVEARHSMRTLVTNSTVSHLTMGNDGGGDMEMSLKGPATVSATTVEKAPASTDKGTGSTPAATGITGTVIVMFDAAEKRDPTITGREMHGTGSNKFSFQCHSMS
jgi:hypothetical protein